MFAPYCPTCQRRTLLGLSRIVESSWSTGGGVTLRCRCGTLVDAEARPPLPSTRNRQAGDKWSVAG